MGAARPFAASRRGDIPTPSVPYAPSVAERRTEGERKPAAGARRGAIFGERPLVTAVLGMAPGRLVASALPRA
ncbi:MAG TPA: hypothetical protein VHT04_17225 [Stellaceae bacterium]|nr:hypothetical protein [Stellaceae bacterium]